MSDPAHTTARETALRAALLDVLVEDAGGVRELADPRDYEDRIALFLPLLLEVSAAAFAEAADAAENVTHLPGGPVYQAGYLDARVDAASAVRRLAAAVPATTTTPQES